MTKNNNDKKYIALVFEADSGGVPSNLKSIYSHHDTVYPESSDPPEKIF